MFTLFVGKEKIINQAIPRRVTMNGSGIMQKTKGKCADCDNRQFSALTDEVVRNHLTGKQTIGVYPILTNETCFFLAVDFDKSSWREDASAYLETCHEMEIPAVLELSRSSIGTGKRKQRFP